MASFAVYSDDLGTYALVSIDTAVYDKDAVMKCAYWYTDTCYLFLSPGDDAGTLQVEFRVKDPTTDSTLEQVARDFCNHLLDQQVREVVARETGDIRDALVKKAFFEGSKHLDPGQLRSNEAQLPTTGQNYTDDPLGIAKPVQKL